MSWIRFDSSAMDDEFIMSLTAEEFKAWVFFLLRTKAIGARGSVHTTSVKILARNWNISPASITGMMDKAGDRISEIEGRWVIKNWRRYQEDYRDKRSSPKNTGNDTEPTTVRDVTVPHETGRMVRTTFVPPTVQQVKEFFIDQNLLDPEVQHIQFWNYYESKGWMVGKTPMKKWEQAAQNWNSRLQTWRKENEAAKSTNPKSDNQSDRAKFRHSEESLANAGNLQASIENRLRKGN